MLSLLRGYLISALSKLPLLMMVVVLALVLGQVSAAALQAVVPESKIALSVESSGALALRYAAALKDISGLTAVDAGADLSKVFSDRSLQGLAVIPPDFDEKLTAGGRAVLFYPAPGIADTSVIEEYLTAEAAVIKAQLQLEQRLEALGAAEGSVPAGVMTEPILTLEYSGLESLPFNAPPAYGVPALLMLLAFLHAAQLVPGADTKRVRMRGYRALMRGHVACSLSLFLIWGLVALLYTGGMAVFYHAAVPPEVTVALVGVGLYAVSLGALVAAAGWRNFSAYVFIPWLLINMTLGGGLWSTAPSHALMPLLPVSQVLSAAHGEPGAALGGLAAAFLCLCGVCGAYAFKSRRP